MDLESRRSESAQPARDIEIPLRLAYDTLRFTPEPDRYARFLRLSREANPGNELPDRLCRYGAVLFLCLAVFDLLIWGLVFANATLILASWAVISVCVALPVLLTEYIRQAFGLASALHRYHSPVLTLAGDRLIFEVKRSMMFRGRHSPTIRREASYGRISRLEYDRSSKTLRVVMLHNAGEAPSLEVPLYFENSCQILEELAKRSGVFIQPAMRGDDYADLRDLPGIRRERGLLRPMSVGALVFCFVSLMAVLYIRGHNAGNPYRPYPQTAEVYLTGSFGVGDSVTLSGCVFTLNGVSRVGSDPVRGGCYQFLVTISNGNRSAVRLRDGEAYRDSPGNFSFTGYTRQGDKLALDRSGAPPGHMGIDIPCPGRLAAGKTVTVTFFVWLPDPEELERVEMSVNSDYWPPADIWRDVTYSGGLAEINGRFVKDNEVRFTVVRKEWQ